ncbi:hypothetical protein CHUAL_001261 [Chamberlinius hualienensis]
MLNLSGVNLCISEQLPRHKRIRFIWWLLRFTILLAASYNFGYQIFTLSNGFGTDDLWILCYNDHLFVLTFLCVITFREVKIKQFTKDLMQLTIFNTENEALIRQIGKTSHFILWISLLLVSYSPMFIYFHAATSVECGPWFQWFYYEFKLESPTLRGIFSVIVESAFCYTCLLVQIYAGFLIFLIYLIGICYQNKSRSFKQLPNISVDQIISFQEQHHRLNEIMDHFNKLFSPSVLVLLLVSMGQIMGTPGNIKSVQVLYDVFPAKSFFALFIKSCSSISPTIRASYILLALLKTTNNVHRLVRQSKEIFDELINTNINHPEIYQSSVEDLVKYCSKSQFFSAKWSSSPAKITASGLFTLDYALIGVILSVTVTYWTLIGEIKDDTAVHNGANFTCFE